MFLTGKIIVNPILPERLSRLKDIAYNLWWSWNFDALDLFEDIDSDLWEGTGKNPIFFLQEVSSNKLEEALNNKAYMLKFGEVVDEFDSYLSDKNTWFNRNYPNIGNHVVAYFSAEYGLNEILPIYSGGLGVLSGDHCKSASDLGIPFTAIGLLYKQGYFSQRINKDGWQETVFSDLDVSRLPLQPALNNEGEQVLINIELPGRMVYAKVWEVKIGRVSLYLMDTDIEQNNESDRWLTARLYGGDQETRVQQEILLGIGGVRILEALCINAWVYHMNEGHSAFLGLEIIRKHIHEKKLSFKAAKEVAQAHIIFTTHTSVPAGNDVFPLYMIDKYFSNYWNNLGISRHQFLDMGLKVNDNQNFNMTVLALTLAGRKNGVSELHGAVTRNIYNNLWPGVPEDEVPIIHITNGIHTTSWLSASLEKLFDKYIGKEWQEKISEKSIWQNIDKVPDNQLWSIHIQLKNELIVYLREKIKLQRISNGCSPENIRETDHLLDPDALTIGFARRFATYKRANLIFRNIERIKSIFNNPEMPVQIIFAGKAHPADRPAHEVIKYINDIASSEGFTGKVVLVEDYNIALARKMVQGVDIWLNNPRRPLEASGTSGQKVCINAIINFSILDGWWCEGFNGNNGWVIGNGTYCDDEYYQDNADSESLYSILESQIIPLYFRRDANGIPTGWTRLMKESIKSLAYRFSTHRTVQDYTNKMYIPSITRVDKIISSYYSYAINLAEWKSFIEENWSQVSISAEKTLNHLKEYKTPAGNSIAISANVNMGNIDPLNVKVEVYYRKLNHSNDIEEPQVKEMKMIEKTGSASWLYTAEIKLDDGGEYSYTFRVIPYHPDLINKFDTGLIRWVVQ
ncbi:MAG TPA: alpha-glucan family phosphorylase [Clostridiales bacterium]|nr:alpha-glucan family phosphorylase [Clostridiales bacterium]